uniref:DUF1003 domain-containing protein n=1 Tax=Loa loa TaxID=7209 RepID=A0A1I7W0T9_LOALO
MYSQSTLSDLSSYLSKIGSDMGLFYGASVISLFELILLLFKTIWALASSSRAVYLEEKAKRERPQRELDQMLSLTLTPEQANAILEAETFVDSIYVLLRRDKLTSTVEDVDSKRCVSVV